MEAGRGASSAEDLSSDHELTRVRVLLMSVKAKEKGQCIIQSRYCRDEGTENVHPIGMSGWGIVLVLKLVRLIKGDT